MCLTDWRWGERGGGGCRGWDGRWGFGLGFKGGGGWEPVGGRLKFGVWREDMLLRKMLEGRVGSSRDLGFGVFLVRLLMFFFWWLYLTLLTLLGGLEEAYLVSGRCLVLCPLLSLFF